MVPTRETSGSIRFFPGDIIGPPQSHPTEKYRGLGLARQPNATRSIRAIALQFLTVRAAPNW